MKFTGQIRIPDLDHPGVPATFLIDGTQAEVILEGEESLGRWSLFDVQARRLISAAFQVELDGEEVTFIADEPIDFAYRGLEEMAAVWARFKSMNIVRRKVAVSRSRSGVRPSRINELRAAMEENLGVRPESVSLPGTSSPAPPSEEATETQMWDRPIPPPAPKVAEPSPMPESDPEPTIPIVSAPPAREASDASDDALAAELETTEEEKAPLEQRLRVTQEESDEVAATLAAERKAIEEERARLAEERRRLEDLHREAEKREEDRVEAFRLEMQRLDRERKEFEKAEEQRQQAHREAMERLEAERSEIERKTAETSQREQQDVERADELQAKLAELEQERVRREQEESERVEAARREIEALEEQQRRMESLEELKEESDERETPDHLVEPSVGEEPAALGETPAGEEPSEELVSVASADDGSTSADSKVVDLGEFEEKQNEYGDGPEDEEKSGPKHLRQPTRRRRAGAKQDQQREAEKASEPQPEPEPQPVAEPKSVAEPQPEPELQPEVQPDREPEPAMAGAAKQSGIMGAVRAAFGRGGREHVHDFVEAPGGLGIARSICRECGYVSISTED